MTDRGINPSATMIDRRDAGILITGSTGYVGRCLVKKLSEQGEPAIALYHHKLPESHPHILPLCLDLSATESLAVALKGVKTVIYLAWERSIVGFTDFLRDEEFGGCLGRKSRNLNNLETFIQAAENAGVRRIIFASANGASRAAKNPFLMEKYCAEVLILNSKIPEKVILRPTILYGYSGPQGDRFMKSIAGLVKYPLFYPVPRCKEQLSPLNVDDFVDILLKLLLQEHLPQSASILETVGPDTIKIEDLFKLVSHQVGKGPQLPIRGSLGNSLVPLYERNHRRKSVNWPAMKDFLSVGTRIHPEVGQDNPLQHLLPKASRSFRAFISQQPTTK